jgi:hypothetical protein
VPEKGLTVRKRDELADPASCLNKAKDDEWVFVLLGRDDATADTVRHWAAKRVELGKNVPGDPQILEALQAADAIDAGRKVAAVPPV